MKLDDCISTVVLGYESIDDRVKDSQFKIDENDSKRNYLEGDRMNFCNHLVSHFCSPGGTTLDLSDDPEGLQFSLACIHIQVLLEP